MKNIKIFPKEWLELHPYKQSTPTDSYYTNIANQIYEIMEMTELVNSFDEYETRQICIRLAAYFEDVISGVGMWRAFILTYKELFGKYIPFYTPDDHYYDDEVNVEDIRFLLWHYTQQYHGYRKGTFVSPDNPANESTGLLIYNLFCKEWTSAPENTRMKNLFDTGTRYEKEEDYIRLLQWFHYDSYLFPESIRELNDFAHERLEEQKDKELNQNQINNVLMNCQGVMAYTSKTSLLGLTSPQWLAKILPTDHPDHERFQTEADESVATLPEDMQEENKKQYDLFQKAANGKLLLYFNNTDDVTKFITETSQLVPVNKFHLPKEWEGRKLAIYATPQDGAQVITHDIELIKDENNPFYDQNRAEKQALSFFIVKHCSVDFLKILMEHGMLADAQTKSLKSVERGKAIIQENWEFLSRYFIREYPEK